MRLSKRKNQWFIWSVVYNQATGKNDTLAGFKTTKTQLNL
jgi:hypothetical protein